MTLPDPTQRHDQLWRAVDDILEPAWRQERKRARRRMLKASALRWAVGMLAMVALATALRIVFVLPWAFFVVVGAMFALGALPSREEWGVLQHNPVEHLQPR